jgi:hypothetical protein
MTQHYYQKQTDGRGGGGDPPLEKATEKTQPQVPRSCDIAGSLQAVLVSLI